MLPATPSIAKKSAVQSLIIDALKDMDAGRWDEAHDKVIQSKNALAIKIYHWLLFTKTKEPQWTNALFIRMAQFVRQNPEWPDSHKMILRAEAIMPDTLSNAEVIAWYNDFPPQTSGGMARYMDSLIIEGKKDQARLFLVDWWASTLTSQEQQRDIFKKYGGFLTLEAHKKRFQALLDKGHYSSARAIASVLGQGYPALAEARIALSKGKNRNLKTLIAKVPSYLQDDPGLLYERLKWRRKKDLDDGAFKILTNMPDSGLISNPKAWWTERHIIIRRLLEKGQHEKAYLLAKNHIQKEGFSYAQAQWLAGWLALRFLNKPEEGYERFESLYRKVKTPMSKARASYWAGRAAHDLKKKDLEQSWYKKAAEFQTVFYGQLANAALSRSNKLPKSKLPRLSNTEKRNYQKNEFVQASEFFRLAGMKKRSNDFLYAFLEKKETPKAYLFVAETFGARTDFYSAVKVAKKATSKGLFLTKQSYPTIIEYMADMHTVEWALIHAMIRQESMFDSSAKSHAGARGLMQLMPKTARVTAKKIGVSYNRGWLTSRPEYNIALGSAYISYLIKRYDNSYPLAIAAYNAGPGRVDSWLSLYGDPRKNKIDIIDWIEMIPIYETRNYIQRVMEGIYIYRMRLSGVQKKPQEDIHLAVHMK